MRTRLLLAAMVLDACSGGGAAPPEPSPSTRRSGYVAPSAGGGRHLALARERGFCAIDRVGEVWCTPRDQGFYTYSTPLVRRHDLGSAVDLAADESGVCAIGRDGAVRCWRDEGITTPSPSDPSVAGHLVVDGGWAALTTDGAVVARGLYRQTHWPTLPSAVDLFSDGGTFCLVATDAHVACTASMALGGVPLAEGALTTMPGLDGARRVVGTNESICTLDDQGVVHCLGGNAGGQLGVADAHEHGPVVPTGLPPLTTIAHAFIHTCGIDAGGSVWCWGARDYYAAADGREVGSVPYRVEALGTVTEIAVAPYTVCAILADDAGLACATIGRDGTSDPVAAEVTRLAS